MANRPQPRFLQACFLAGAGIWLLAGARRPRRPLLWSALMFAADLIAIPAVLRAKPVITPDELWALDPDRLPAMDKPALRLPVAHFEAIRLESDMLLRILVVAPAGLLLDRRLRTSACRWLPEYAWLHALTYTIYTFSPLGPAFVDRYRPIVYRQELPLAVRARGNNRNARYSGHTGSGAFAMFFLARMITLRWKLHSPGWYLLAALPALLLGAQRVRAQKHFPSDVLLAALIGGGVAVTMPGADVQQPA